MFQHLSVQQNDFSEVIVMHVDYVQFRAISDQLPEEKKEYKSIMDIACTIAYEISYKGKYGRREFDLGHFIRRLSYDIESYEFSSYDVCQLFTMMGRFMPLAIAIPDNRK